MPASQIIVFPRKETTESDKLAKIIAMEKLSAGFAGFSDMLNKGIDAYQTAKAKKQASDLAGIGAAASLVGGYDMLPQETKNKLPGIVGVDMKRDDKGNVIIDPTAKDLTDRAIKDALAKDPEGFARVIGGVQDKAMDPTQAAVNREATAQKDRADQLQGKLKVLEIENQNNRSAFEQSQQNQRNKDDIASRERVAGKTQEQKVAHDNAPSGLWLDRKTGKTMDKRAAEMAVGIDEKFEDRFYMPTNLQLEQINDRDTANARVERSRIQNETDKTRQAWMDARTKKLGEGPNGDLLAAALVGLRRAQIADNADSTDATRAAVEGYSKEIQRLYGQEVPPEEHGSMLRNFGSVLESAWTWYQGKYGTTEPGPQASTPGAPPAPTVATPKEKIVQTPAEGKPAPVKAGGTSTPVNPAGAVVQGGKALKGQAALDYLGITE